MSLYPSHLYLRSHDFSIFGNLNSASDLSSKLGNVQESIGQDMLEIARRRYTWATIARQYESLY